jgi:hypothetical protein
MSNAWPEPAQKLIAQFYTALFGMDKKLCEPKTPFQFSTVNTFASGNDSASEAEYKLAYSLLKENLEHYGVKVPVLYKQYVELCQPGGCRFLGFNIDPKFSNCVDALILVDIGAIKEKKYQRYIESHAVVDLNLNSA